MTIKIVSNEIFFIIYVISFQKLYNLASD